MPRFLAFLRYTERRIVTTPGGIGGSCVDLCNEYLRWCYGEGHVWRNAVDWATIPLLGWGWVANSPANFPGCADIVVWGPCAAHGIGAAGHVAICIDADPMMLITWDQNWPAGAPAWYVEHDYQGILGWHYRL